MFENFGSIVAIQKKKSDFFLDWHKKSMSFVLLLSLGNEHKHNKNNII